MPSGFADRRAHQARRKLRIGTRLRLLVRANIRDSQLGLLVIAAMVGIGAGLGVALSRHVVSQIHHAIFGVPFETHLSSAKLIEPWRILIVPCLGGLVYGAIAYVLRRWRPRDIVDAIEANALYGGSMSLTDSIRLTILTILSAGVGASIGLEAAYTQLGSGLASKIGKIIRLRRSDLRTLVGCGAAGAIAAAFNAPLAGAFYAFELIIGNYSPATLAPVTGAAVASTIVERALFGGAPIFKVPDQLQLSVPDYAALALLGVAAGGIGIVAMIGVTRVEALFRRIALPTWLRPAAGGLILGTLALVFPQVLSSGHGGIDSTISPGFELPVLIGLLIAKLSASALSIGSGFRGGMFSSSLFLGSLFGAAVAALAQHVIPWEAPDRTLFILAGMGAVAAAIVGAPVTMILLVLEATGDFSATIGVTAAVLVASFMVRVTFGYSFATWRFHLRGVPLRGAHDIGWLQDLTVAKTMRQDPITVPRTMTLRELREQFPIGGTKQVFVVDEDGRYAGVVDVLEAHGVDANESGNARTVAAMARDVEHFLLPYQPVRLALDLFVATEEETLVVINNRVDRQVVGYLTEAYALRRYTKEFESRERDERGDDELFSPQTFGED